MSDPARKLGYGVPNDTSVVVNRTIKRNKFERDSYNPRETAICIFPTGTDYIDTRRSYLSFELKTPPTSEGETTTRWLFGVHGSACNIIKTVTIYARSGEELCRIEDFNLFSNMMLPLTHERDWFNRQGAGMWCGDRIYASSQTCVIPMYILSPLFGYGRLLPAALVSGMRVELTLEETDKAFFGALHFKDNQLEFTIPIGLGEDYSISDIRFNLETVKLGDSIRMALEERTSTSGLELVYFGWRHTFTEPGHDMQKGVQLTISDSYARALRAFARVRSRENPGESNGVIQEKQRDSFRAEHIFPVSEYQWRLGERYYPDKPVSNGGRPIIETYTNTLIAADQWNSKRSQSFLPLLHDDTMSAITGETMAGSITAGVGATYLGFLPSFVGQIGSFTRDSHVIGVDLTRDSNNGFSGRPVNNVEPLTLFLKGNTNILEYQHISKESLITSPPLRRLDLYMQYAKLVRVFTNNVEIEK